MPDSHISDSAFHNAVEDFHAARLKAGLETVLSTFTGKPHDLLQYDEVRKNLRGVESSHRVVEDVPLNAIVGTVSRYSDFSRSFLPLKESDRERWARVRLGVETLVGLPPIDVYRVGDAYFVLDGHHRVSVARELGAETIQANVIPVQARVGISPTDSPEDLILKTEYTAFLEQTAIDRLRPDANLLVTAPGQYPNLLEHIAVHRYFMGLEQQREVSEAEAITHWYDTVYTPIAQLIRARHLLRDFPHRTETDLYLWLMEHRMELGGGMGWEVRPEVAAADLSAQYARTRRLPRFLQRVERLLLPDALEDGPPAGYWRRELLATPFAADSPAPAQRDNRLFDDLMVSVPSLTELTSAAAPDCCSALVYALEVARREDARLTGLHVVADRAALESPAVRAVTDAFHARCQQAGVTGRMLVEVDPSISHRLVQRSLWVDLLVFRLIHPPPLLPLVRLRSGARRLIRQSASPLLAIPPKAPPTAAMRRVLLGYGGGARAEEALFVAAYLAGRWGMELTVVAVEPPPGEGAAPAQSRAERAQTYLAAQGVQARILSERGDPVRLILLDAEQARADLLVMGGYEASPLRESFVASTLDRILTQTRLPVMICR